jgi:serine/threonine-protein phosphatase 2B regulatory subunit
LDPTLLLPTAQVNFSSFVRTLSLFSDRSPPAAKLRFAFDIYDVDADGFISARDLFHVLRAMCGANVDAAQLETISEATIADADADRDGQLSFAEFEQVMASSNTSQALTLKFF